MRVGRSLSLAVLFLMAAIASGAPPTVTDDRLVIELAAAEPDIVTPTGLTVDEQGRVWVIENNTHQRQATYKGFESDRVRVFSDPGPDGKFRKITTFADGFKNSMSLALGRDGVVYLATRSDIWRLRDTKGTGAADERKAIVKLESTGDYPHNGLSGFAFDPAGEMYFSLGENLGAPYKLIGSDGTTLSGGGEGGSIYHCRPDGAKLERFATGFWNTFNLTFDGFGRLFAVDNDPDARGPCRLLHIVRGGDYGYRFRFGRKGLHPFVAWNGELPGTLPLVAGTGEAPSGIIAYESNGLPAEYRGRLLVTSWGDHVVEQFTPTPRGASFTSKSVVLVRGGDDFRPVGIASAPDGSLYLSDWVDKSYPVHGKGRIWHVRMKEPPKDDGLRPAKVAGLDVERLHKLLSDPRREVRGAAAEALAGKGRDGEAALAAVLKDGGDARARLHALWGLARLEPAAARKRTAPALDDAAPEVRAEAVRLQGALLPNGDGRDETKLLALALKDAAPLVRMQALLQLRNKASLEAIMPVLGDVDPFLVSAALDVLGRPGNLGLLTPEVGAKDTRLRLGVLVALRRGGEAEARKQLAKFLADSDPTVRRAAVQWVGEERLQDFKDTIAPAAAKEPVTRDLFEALLAAQALLAPGSKPGEEPSGEEFVAQVVKDAKQPAVFRTLGLRMLRPDHPALTPRLLKDMLDGPDKALAAEAVRTLAQRPDKDAQELLRHLAGDENGDAGGRAFAVLGLAHSAPTSAETRKLLLSLFADTALRRDALRSLRGIAPDDDERTTLFNLWDRLPKEKDTTDARRELAEQVLLVLGPKVPGDLEERRKRLADLVLPHPTDAAGWGKLLSGDGDAAAGERVFFHLRGPRCASCHRIDGRGGSVGPDLSAIAASSDRAKLIESILTPSKEIAPAFTTWVLTLRNGKTHTGVIISENFDSTITLGLADGKTMVLNRNDVEDRQASPKSLMPDDLHLQMTQREFLDLLTYLGTTRGRK